MKLILRTVDLVRIDSIRVDLVRVDFAKVDLPWCNYSRKYFQVTVQSWVSPFSMIYKITQFYFNPLTPNDAFRRHD